jgi:hypothetical protein
MSLPHPTYMIMTTLELAFRVITAVLDTDTVAIAVTAG